MAHPLGQIGMRSESSPTLNKRNGLDPYRYLLWVLQNAPQLSETDEAWAEKLLPANAPEEYYMPQK